MMDPDPLLQPLRHGVAKLAFEAALDQRSVPPRTHREERVRYREAVAVAGNAEFAHFADPARDLFALRAAVVEVVIARAEDDAGYSGQQRQVFFHHQDLGTEIDHRSDVERVAGENDDVELRRSREQPV